MHHLIYILFGILGMFYFLIGIFEGINRNLRNTIIYLMFAVTFFSVLSYQSFYITTYQCETIINQSIDYIDYEDLRFPDGMLINGAFPPDPCIIVNSTYGLCFNGAALRESMQAIAQMPHERIENSSIEPHIHWGPSDNANGTVIWQLEYTCADMGEVFQPTQKITISDQASGIAHDHQYASFHGINNSLKKSAICLFELIRDPGVSGDNYTSDAILYEFDVHYQKAIEYQNRTFSQVCDKSYTASLGMRAFFLSMLILSSIFLLIYVILIIKSFIQTKSIY